MNNKKLLSDKDLAILEQTICTMNGAKSFERRKKNQIFDYVHKNLSEDEFWTSSEELKKLLSHKNEDEFLRTLWLSEDIFVWIDDDLRQDKDKLNTLLHLSSMKDLINHISTVYGDYTNCPMYGELYEFTEELKQEAIDNRGLITCPHCKEQTSIFDLDCNFYCEIFDIYMWDIYKQKFKVWAKEFRSGNRKIS